MNFATEIYDKAKEYIDQGYVIFPVQNTLVDGKTQKKPLVSRWQMLGTRDMERVLPMFKSCNGIGMPTGRVNGIFVLDVDGGDITGKELPPTPIVKTGRGMHYYFKHEHGYGNTVNAELKLDTRGEGGFVVLPPSWHHQGTYEWVIGLGEEELAPLPLWIHRLARKQGQRVSIASLSKGVGDGGRNNSAASVIGYILAKIDMEFWEDFAWEGLRAWNRRNAPPMDEEELYKVFISIASREKLRREGYAK